MSKKSKIIKLTMLSGISILLNACEPAEPEKPELLKDEKACVEKYQDEEGCHNLMLQAQKDFEEKAPKFNQQSACEAQFGPAQCHRDNSGYFMPFMEGYLISSVISNNQRQYAVQSACNNNGSIFSNGCGNVSGARVGYIPINSYYAGTYTNGNYARSETFSNFWTSGKVQASRVNVSEAAIARGGFGGSAVGEAGE